VEIFNKVLFRIFKVLICPLNKKERKPKKVKRKQEEINILLLEISY
jgi:hypothetical protein